MSEGSDSGDVAFELPVFLLIDRQRFQKQGLPYGIITFGTPEYEQVIPIFRNGESATEFANTQGMQGFSPLELKTEKGLLAILKDSKKAKISHVGFNIIGKSGQYYPIDEFITDLFGPQ